MDEVIRRMEGSCGDLVTMSPAYVEVYVNVCIRTLTESRCCVVQQYSPVFLQLVSLVCFG